MFFRLLLLFTVLPIIELMLLVWVKDQTTFSFTIGLVLVTGFVGASLARWQGWRTVERMQNELAAGKMPTDAILDGVMILLAGAVLITPGILTDTFGFLLLIPPVRTFLKAWARRRMLSRMSVHTYTHTPDGWTTESHTTSQVVEGQIVNRTSDEDTEENI